jgi:hypothetical protein
MYWKAEHNPNQFQVFRETQRVSSVPGSMPESRTAPWVLQLNFLVLFLRIVQISHLKHQASGLKEEIWE